MDPIYSSMLVRNLLKLLKLGYQLKNSIAQSFQPPLPFFTYHQVAPLTAKILFVAPHSTVVTSGSLIRQIGYLVNPEIPR